MIDQQHARLDVPDFRGNRPLHIALHRSYFDIARRLLEKDRTIVNLPGAAEDYPLHLAAKIPGS